MGNDETLARLKVLSERLDRIRRQAQEIQNVAEDEVRTAYTHRSQRPVPNSTERRARKRA